MYKLILSFQNKSTQVTGHYPSGQPLRAQSCPTAADSRRNSVKPLLFNTQQRAAGSAGRPQIMLEERTS